LYAAYQKKLDMKLRIEAAQAGLRTMMQFTDSEAFLYDYQKAIDSPLIFQKNMMYKMYFAVEGESKEVLQEITDVHIKRPLWAQKMDGDALFYAWHRYAYYTDIQTSALQLINSETVISYYKERLNKEPVQPDLIDLYRAGKDLFMMICVRSYFKKDLGDYTILGLVARFKPNSVEHIVSVLKNMFKIDDEKANPIAQKIYAYFEKK
jgi:hypothetical protein